jgi:CDP-6-deoxy-D-xylo-4-hexulose-3-dehydrase
MSESHPQHDLEPNLAAMKVEILSLVKEYSSLTLTQEEFEEFKTPIPVSGKVLYPEDISTLVESCLDGWLTSGRFTSNFESSLAKFVGTRYALFVNSGSSANLLALSALTSPKLGDRALKPGDEVLTVAMGFPTTINPIIQNKLIPVFVDIDIKTLNVDVQALQGAISPKTRAVMLAHTLGNPFDLDAVQELCKKNNLWLIEDCCDALGATYKGRKTGSFGDLATLSFYPAHHITTGEGGAVLVKSPVLKKQVESFRDWGRDCYCETGADNTCKKRFEWQLGELPRGYDHKYIYSNIGYNLKATDMQAAIGFSQLNKIEVFVEKRKKNFAFLKSMLAELEEISVAEPTPNSDPSWFGFPITIVDSERINREELLRFLNSRNIGTRLVFAGNITKQPAYMNSNLHVVGNLRNTDLAMKNTFWVGTFPGLNDSMLTFIAESIRDFIRDR